MPTQSLPRATRGDTGCLEGDAMLDLLMLLFLTMAFSGAIGYVRACASLTRKIGTASGDVR
jgi:hypothetical protein